MDNAVLRISYQSILQQGKKLTLHRRDGTHEVLKATDPEKDYGEYWEQLIFIGTVPDSAIDEIESIAIPPERQELFSPKEKKVSYLNCIHLSLIPADELGRRELAKAKHNARIHEAKRRKIEDDELNNRFSECSINPGFEYTAYIKTMEVLDGILPSSLTSEHAEADKLQQKTKDKKQNSVPIIKVVNARPKGGRRPKKEEKILYAYIYLSFCYMVKHPNKKGAIETPPSFANAVKGRIKRGGGNLLVNSRTFDKGKNPGRFYRYLIAKKYGVYLYGYTELDYINDKDFADKCIAEATVFIKSLDDKRKKKLLEGLQ